MLCFVEHFTVVFFLQQVELNYYRSTNVRFYLSHDTKITLKSHFLFA